MGVTIRHYFNSRHARKGNPRWTWGVTAAIFAIIMALSFYPLVSVQANQAQETAQRLTPHQTRQRNHPLFENVQEIVAGRCSMCHAKEPLWEGLIVAPKNVYLESDHDILRQAEAIIVHTALSDAMPPANITYMEPEERLLLQRWFLATKK